MWRAEGLRRLANKLGGPSPSCISDAFLPSALGEPSLDPRLLEKWLVRAGEYNPDAEGDSIEGCIARNYGEPWAELARSLI